MAEPPATTRAAAVTAERDVLATKLHVPQTRRGFVARPRLADRLAQARGGELTLVCAPAGFGKTTLLADWARRSQRPVAWLSLDEADNDPARFWRHATAALDRVRPVDADRVAALLQDLQPTSFEAAVTALVNELAGVAEAVVLVLDDYHLIQAAPVQESVEFLLGHLPPQLRLVVASRTDPPLPLARLRARGQLVEVRERDLRFTPQEAAALLREAVGSELPEAAVAGLQERTEGWVAGLQLAALSLRGRGDLAGFVEGFSGSHRYVLDYLTEEVLARQPDHLVRFLLETSVLERLCGPLCAAVTGHTDSQALLEQIERANLFLVPLDEVRRWYRFHQLFADLLRARLAQEQPQRLPELHASAAAWCEQHGLVDDAIRHALAAGELVWVARLIEQHTDAMLWHSEDATVRRWLEALPAELVRSRPRLCLAQACAAVIGVRLEAAASLLDDAERALADRGDQPQEPFEPSVGRAASLLANVPAGITLARAVLARMHGNAERTIEFSRRALAQLGEGERMLRSLVDYYLAVADWLCGRAVEAEQALAGLAAEQLAPGTRYLAPLYHNLGQVQRARGHLGAALRTYEKALAIASQAGRPLPPAGIAHVDIAEVRYERGELDAALEHATQGVALSRQLGWAPPMAALLRQLLAGRRQERPAADGAPREYLARLADAFEQAGLPVRPPVGRGGVVVAGLVEPLTARELEVLGLLAAGAPNRAIAEQLVVTQETVKKHLSHLFDKLGAANRTQAVVRARELGLLP